MKAPPPQRRRAVRLTPDALESLRRALAERWQAGDGTGRLTWEARAELMDVSVATAKKIDANGGADRNSLAHAFKNLGLAWDDALCEPLVREPVASAAEVPATEPPTEPEPPPEPAPAKARPRGRTALAAVLLGLALAGAWGFGARRPAEDWKAEFDRRMEQGGELFHKARYDAAQTQIERAWTLARGHDSLNCMAFSNHVLGEIAGARGHLREAYAAYDGELRTREMSGPGARRPVVYEALGEIETRLGDYPNAQAHLTRALDEYRSIQDPVGVASAQRYLASVALGLKELDAADAWLRQSLDGLRGLDQPGIEADVRDRQAQVLLARGRWREARTLFQGSLGYWKAQDHPRWIALTEMHLALAEASLGETASARTRLARSLDAFKRVGDEARIAEAAAHLRDLR